MRYGYRTLNLALLLFLATNCFAAQDMVEAPEKDKPVDVAQVNEEIRKLYVDVKTNTASIATNTTAIAAISSTIVQVVNTMDGGSNTGTTAIPNDDSIPLITEGDEYMTLAITPTSASNKLKIDVVLCGSHSAANEGIVAALFNTDTHLTEALAVAATDGNGGFPNSVSFTHYMTAPGTGTYTFRVRASSNAGSGATFTFNGTGGGRKHGGAAASSITIWEIIP